MFRWVVSYVIRMVSYVTGGGTLCSGRFYLKLLG